MRGTRGLTCCVLAVASLLPHETVARAGRVGTFEMGRRAVAVNSQSLEEAVAQTRASRCTKIRVLVLLDESFVPDELSTAGARLVSRVGEVATVEVCEEVARHLKAIGGIRRVRMPQELEPCMDSVRVMTRLDQAHGTIPSNLPQAYTGEGILVGVMDTEFETCHPAYLDSSGKTRFVAVWDQQDTSIADQNRYGYGVIKMRDELVVDSLFSTGTRVHGTHMASTAAGSDRSVAYYGTAPDAMLIGVRYGGTDNELVNGLEWIFSIADSLGVPCAVNMSIGVAVGPHDGSSLLDRAVDSLSGEGRIVVGAMGNDGIKNGHALFELGRGESAGVWATSFVYYTDPGDPTKVWTYSGVDLWGDSSMTFSIGTYILDTVTLDYVQSTSSVSTWVNSVFDPDTIYWPDTSAGRTDTCIVQVLAERSAEINTKPHAQVVFRTNNPDLCLGVEASTGDGPGQAQDVHAWHVRKLALRSYGIAGFYDGDNSYSVNEVGGTPVRNITVGSYVSKRDLLLWDGSIETISWDDGDLYHLATFSAHGPTVDGRVKPDITAPGCVIMGAVSRFYDAGDNKLVGIWPDTTELTGRYAAYNGTSVSSPIVTGIIAMMLQVDPTLTPEEARQILQDNAITDEFTGPLSTPDNLWGAGKVNALGALQDMLGLPTRDRRLSAHQVSQGLRLWVRGGSHLVVGATHKGPPMKSRITVYDLHGRTLFRANPTASGTVGLPSSIVPGVYSCVIRSEQGAVLLEQKMILDAGAFGR